ncbi:hypothetical protein [Salibacterium lacus]|uniref:DUF4355 domain-containing protein n=1 Tax=Salibacterium lacus TaxID=1898109 RepID=A0ABW5SW73_9BACI
MAEENTTYSEEQVQEQIEQAKQQWKENELNPVVQERDELKQYKPDEKSEEQKKVEQKEKELFEKEVNIELQQKGLEDFADVIQVSNKEELNNMIEQLEKVVNQRKLDNSYQPENHKQSDEYSNAKSNGNTKDMIKALFSSN